MVFGDEIVVRLERQPNRAAIQRLREAYRHLSEVSQPMSAGAVEAQQEGKDERDSGLVRTGIDATTGTGGDD